VSAPSTKYARAIIETDTELRRRTVNGTRVKTNAKEIAEAINVVVTTASSCLAYLARVSGSGLTKVPGENGQYEFRTPEHYPKDLEELRSGLRHNPGPPPKSQRRGNLMTEFLTWFEKLSPGQVFTTGSVALALEASVSSAGNCVRRLAKHGGCEHLEGNLYRKHGTPTVVIDSLSGLQRAVTDGILDDVAEDEARIAGLATWSESTSPGFAGSEYVEPEDEAEPQPNPHQRLAPTPATVKAAIDRTRGTATGVKPPSWGNSGEYLYLTDNKKGEPLLRHPNGRIGVWHEV
jgi:hypothetical protein